MQLLNFVCGLAGEENGMFCDRNHNFALVVLDNCAAQTEQRQGARELTVRGSGHGGVGGLASAAMGLFRPELIDTR